MNRPRIDTATIRLGLTARAAELAIALLGEPNRAMSSRRELRFGRRGSLAVALAGPKAGKWYDHEAGAGGDMLKLIMRERGVGFRDAVGFAEHLLGRPPLPAEIQRPQRPQHLAVVERDTANAIRDALNIWREAVRVRGTVAERYLQSRGLGDLVLEVDGTALRFHPRCPWRRNDGDPVIKVPALIGLFRDIHTDEPRAIHRRPLTGDGRKLAHWKALGPQRGCAIKLNPSADVTDHLTIGEGAETTLSGMVLGYAPAWVAGNTSGLKAFPVLSGVESLTILVDRDRGGEDAALACSARWTAVGRKVFRVVPRQAGKDVNDLLVARLGTASKGQSC